MTTATRYYPGILVDYQDCRWKVIWSDGEKVGIQSCGGTEAIAVAAELVRPADSEA
jgi:hypothetical protein